MWQKKSGCCDLHYRDYPAQRGQEFRSTPFVGASQDLDGISVPADDALLVPGAGLLLPATQTAAGGCRSCSISTSPRADTLVTHA